MSIHVSAHRPAREPRIPGIIGHRLQTRDVAASAAAGLPLEHPVRAWRQAGTLWALDDLVAAADAMISGDRPLADIDGLREEIGAMGDVRRGILNRALQLVRAGPRSPREAAYPRWRVCPEYDGRVHAEDAVQFAKDADRWDRIRAEGWDHVRVLNHHMRGDARAAVTKVADALVRAGWRP